ncbi:hypothetical protein Tco_1159252, partial [Tanacetum coccineum]
PEADTQPYCIRHPDALRSRGLLLMGFTFNEEHGIDVDDDEDDENDF